MTDSLLKRAKEWLAVPRIELVQLLVLIGPRAFQTPNTLLTEAVAALESDRALLRRLVDGWDYAGNMKALIDEARARIGEGK